HTGKLIRIKRTDAAQHVQQFRREPLRLAVAATAMDNAMADGGNGRETDVLVQPGNQLADGVRVVGDRDRMALWLFVPTTDREHGVRQSDAVERSGQLSLRRFATSIQREFDTRRATVDRQD